MKTKRKVLSILIAMVMALGVLAFMPVTASAASSEVTIDVGDLVSEPGIINNGDVAGVSKWGYDGSLKRLYLNTDGGKYRLTGNNNSIAIRVTQPNITVTLDDLRITSAKKTPAERVFEIYDNCSNAAINLVGTSTLIAEANSSNGVTENAFVIGENNKCTITSVNDGSLFVRTVVGGMIQAGTAIKLSNDAALAITGNASVSTTESGTQDNCGMELTGGSKLSVGANATLNAHGNGAIRVSGSNTLISVDGILIAQAYGGNPAINDIQNKRLAFAGKGTIICHSNWSEGLKSIYPIKMGDELTIKITNGIYLDYTQSIIFEKSSAAGTHVWNLTDSLTTADKLTASTITTSLPKNSTGTISRENVTPSKTSISKITVGKKKMKVTWKKLSPAQKVTKYQLRYRVKGTSKWTTKTYAASASSATIKKLKKGKTYQVQVCSYRTIEGKNFFSPWSATKTSKKVK